MVEKEVISEEAFNEIVDGFEFVEKLTPYGRKNLKYHIKRLQQENQELKKQLEKCSKINIADHKYASKCEDKVITMENQQKEFIEWLEIRIKDRDKVRKMHELYSLSEERLSSQYFILQDVLSKYKEIVGVNGD